MSADLPIQLFLHIPIDWEMPIGTSRSLDVSFLPESCVFRAVTWMVSDPQIARIDSFGRVTALNEGLTEVTVFLKDNLNIKASAILTVSASPKKFVRLMKKKDLIFNAANESNFSVFQKFVDRYSFEQAKLCSDFPQALLDCLDNDNHLKQASSSFTKVNTLDGAIWTIEPYGIKRSFSCEKQVRNREMRFMGNRYLPDNDSLIVCARHGRQLGGGSPLHAWQ